MAKGKVKINQFSAATEKILREFASDTSAALEEAAKKTAKEAAKKLQETSPRGYTGQYAKGWEVSANQDAALTGQVVHNATDYQLTHLLEFGHNLVRDGRVIGFVKPVPHIAQVEKWVQEEFPKELERQVKKG